MLWYLCLRDGCPASLNSFLKSTGSVFDLEITQWRTLSEDPFGVDSLYTLNPSLNVENRITGLHEGVRDLVISNKIDLN